MLFNKWAMNIKLINNYYLSFLKYILIVEFETENKKQNVFFLQLLAPIMSHLQVLNSIHNI